MPVQPRLLNLSIFINEHLRDDLTLEVLAARMNLSPFHFHRKFRAYFGESLHQHIKRLRLEGSAHALLYRLSPVSAVARNSGYKTLSAFSHAFSAHFGVAPTRFREVMLMGRLAQSEAALKDRLGAHWVESLTPAQIAHCAERTISFERADLVRADQPEVAFAALDRLWDTTKNIGESIVASVDLYGILTANPFRVLLGQNAATLDTPMRSGLGETTLSAGRYAMFDLEGSAGRIADVLRAVYHFWLPRSGERARASAHYASFLPAPGHACSSWRLYVPLEGTTAAATVGAHS